MANTFRRIKMKRRDFVAAGIAVITGSILSKKKKSGHITPTHTIEAKSKANPEEGIRFPCVLRADNKLKVGSTVRVDWEETEMEEFIVTKVENTTNQHIEKIRMIDA